jgi:transcriptional regulator with XRE-family HTH domain
MGARLREERDRLGLTQQQIADWIGTTKGLVSQWELGGSEIQAYDLAELGEKGFDTNYVLRGSRLVTSIHHFTPLVTMAELTALASGKLRRADIKARVPVLVPYSSQALSLHVPPESRSMEPRLAPGTRITFDPEKLPTGGDIVVVVLIDVPEALIGRYRPGSGRSLGPMLPYELVFDNEKFFPPRKITHADKAVFMGTLVEETDAGSR